ncbi:MULTISPECIES: type II toxin-antitoxin system VapC family toxin [Roseobacteraceae]|uniref:type II toxin-antitoxin system VapC family toxin n=1 Tax=Roseobacteraceae TaxID=2854170 RepID=UPI0021A8C8AA|nr:MULTISPECIES: type II toxin-antitoxin system VapC family toxin [Roseobacteraceae]UWQ77425.1 type II toxin-antitoxin system VapC family toxin [Leisingera sp. M658]
MIILDTNVISQPMKAQPNPNVVEWLNEQHEEALFTTTVNIMELRFGIEKLPDGKRKLGLWSALDFTLSRLIGPRVFPLDLAAAEEAARIAAMNEAAGKKTGTADGLIAAIAKSRGFAVATRDVGPFKDSGVEVINPWDFRSH